MSGLEQARCVFHFNRAAVDKCEKCGRMICLECKMIHRVRMVDEADSVYTFCPPCYQTVQKQAATFSKIFGIVFLLVCAFIVIFAIVFFIFTMNQMAELFP